MVGVRSNCEGKSSRDARVGLFALDVHFGEGMSSSK